MLNIARYRASRLPKRQCVQKLRLLAALPFGQRGAGLVNTERQHGGKPFKREQQGTWQTDSHKVLLVSNSVKPVYR